MGDTAERYRGPRAECSWCRLRASVRISGRLVCWEHYNEAIKEVRK